MANGTNRDRQLTARLPRPNTFQPITLDVQKLASLPFAEFVKELLADLGAAKDDRFAFYEGLRRSNASWANGARRALAVLGGLGLLLISLASGVRLAPDMLPDFIPANSDRALLFLVLVIYAVMGGISFYERGSDRTSSYFRQIVTILTIRDLWTKLEFDVLKELLPLKDVTDPAVLDPARARLLAVAQAFCTELDKVATGELAEFKTELLTSLTELEAASKKGLDDTLKALDEASKEAKKAAADAKAAAEKAASDAREAIKRAEEAARPGSLNVTVVGDFDDEVSITISGAEVARSRGKQIGVERVPHGATKIGAHAKKGPKTLETSQVIDVKPGLQEVRLTLA